MFCLVNNHLDISIHSIALLFDFVFLQSNFRSY